MSVPLNVLKRVDAYLKQYLSKKSGMKGSSSVRSSSSGSSGTDEGLFEQPDLQASSRAVLEKILRQRSLQMRDQQTNWQVIFRGNII